MPSTQCRLQCGKPAVSLSWAGPESLIPQRTCYHWEAQLYCRQRDTQDLHAERRAQLTPFGPLSAATEKHNGGSGTALGLWIKNHCVIMCVPDRHVCLHVFVPQCGRS